MHNISGPLRAAPVQDRRKRCDHDQKFKILLFNYFAEFLELFFPELVSYVDKPSLSPLDKELLKELHASRSGRVDLLMQAKHKGEDSIFVIHLEAQATRRPRFPRRMFTYFARIYEKYKKPVYPIAVLSYDKPRNRQVATHTVGFPDMEVMHFQYRTVQLNQLKWKNYRGIPNPVAVAFMPKMNVAYDERVEVKLECTRTLKTLNLDPDKLDMILAFVESYLPLDESQEHEYQEMLNRLEKKGKEEIMELISSFRRQGREEGREEGREVGRLEGREEGRLEVIEKQLTRRLGKLDEGMISQIRSLSAENIDLLCEALLDFLTPADLDTWLRSHSKQQ